MHARALTAPLSALVSTNADAIPLIARVTLGLVMLPHGAQKTLGWFGGYGFEGTMGFFTGTMGVPWILALLAILAESLGAIALVVGGLGRLAAFGIACNMAVAIATSHWQHGLLMNWSGTQQGEGFEYHLLAIALAAVVLIRGSGLWSIDRLAARRVERAERSAAPRTATAAA